MSMLYDGSEILLTPYLQYLCDFTHKPRTGTTYWRATTNGVLITSIVFCWSGRSYLRFLPSFHANQPTKL